jgi:hypothetical protein
VSLQANRELKRVNLNIVVPNSRRTWIPSPLKCLRTIADSYSAVNFLRDLIIGIFKEPGGHVNLTSGNCVSSKGQDTETNIDKKTSLSYTKSVLAKETSPFTRKSAMREMFVTLEEFLFEVSNLPTSTLYRGHSSSSYSLKPSIGRCEYPGKNACQVEKVLFSRFKLKSQLFFKGGTELDWLIFARHYGLNTRILDWTRSHYIALYFALQNRSKIKHEPFCVIAYSNPPLGDYFDIREKHPFDMREDIYIEPPNLDSRIANQHAFLSIHADPFNALENEDLTKFSFYPCQKTLIQIEKELVSVGISHATIYPGPDGIAKHLNENPDYNDVGLHLQPAGPSWQPIPNSMIGKTANEFLNYLRTERLFSSILEMNTSQVERIIGLPVVFDNGENWFFHTYKPIEKEAIFLNRNGLQREELRLDSIEFQKIKVDQEIINKIVPEVLWVRRKIE